MSRPHCTNTFTEPGAIMAASVLNSPRAIEASVWVVRAFVKMREALAINRLVLRKLGELDAKVGAHDAELKAVVAALKSLMVPPDKKKRDIGFGAGEGAQVRPKGKKGKAWGSGRSASSTPSPRRSRAGCPASKKLRRGWGMSSACLIQELAVFIEADLKGLEHGG